MPRPKSDAAQSILYRYVAQPDKDPDTLRGVVFALAFLRGKGWTARVIRIRDEEIVHAT